MNLSKKKLFELNWLLSNITLAWYFFIAEYRSRKLGIIYLLLEPLTLFAIYYFLLYALLGGRSATLIWHLIVGIFVFQAFRSIADELLAVREKFRGVMAVSGISVSRLMLIRFLVGLVNAFAALLLLGAILLISGNLSLNVNALFGAATLLALAIGIGLVGSVLKATAGDFGFFINEGFRVLFFTSGILFTGETMPDEAMAVLRFNPVLVGIDLVREGLTGVSGFEHRSFVAAIGVPLLLIVAGTLLLRFNKVTVRNRH